MSIESEINRLEGAKEDISTFATNAGISVTSTTTLDEIGAALKDLTVAPVVQTTGSSTTSVMSQSATTNEFKKYTSLIPYGTAIAANSDLNTTAFLKVGNYYCSQNANVATLTNCPTTLAFMMQVYSPLSTTIDNETTKAWVYRLRKIITHKGVEYYQFVNSGATAGTFTYGAWVKQANETDVAQKADKTNGIYYIVGDGTTAGKWTGTCDDITEYYDGLTIAYRINIAGVSGGTTLNINGLGAIAVRRNASAVTTHYGVNSLIHLTYTTIDGVGYWQTADYDSNTKNSAGTTNKVGSKMYLVGATSQGSNPTTYSNKNVYIGTDNSLYSNATKVATVNDISGVSVKDSGAKGDGSTDDTSAFTTALANNRVVFVPGGTYKLNGTLTIRENCCLELSQDTVLNFTQTSGNCINMTRSACLKGNHGTINVPYTFNSSVVYIGTDIDSEGNNTANVPPWTKWTPMWKTARYVTDINICKPDSSGYHLASDLNCYGKAIDMKCDVADDDEQAINTYIWGTNLSGIRIAGGFKYGIHTKNIGSVDNAWNHDMRIEAVIQSCEVGVYAENTNSLHLAVTVQPVKTYIYAKQGIVLKNSRHADLSSACVWDWNTSNSLFGTNDQYMHLALYGDCRGLILSDFIYYESSTDIRDLIYTDTASNLEQMTILQEPITRWFKPVEGVPYFYDGYTNKKLMTQEEMDAHFDTDLVKSFTDKLATATDANGNIYNGVGYVDNTGYYNAAWGGYQASTYYMHTGFIPVKAGDVIYGSGLSFNKANDGNCRIYLYDSSRSITTTVSATNMISQGASNYYTAYEGDDDSFELLIKAKDNAGWAVNTSVAYIRFQMLATSVGENPMISVNEEIKYSYEGFLADGISVKGDSIILSSPSGKGFKLTVSDSGTLSATQIT